MLCVQPVSVALQPVTHAADAPHAGASAALQPSVLVHESPVRAQPPRVVVRRSSNVLQS